MRIAAILPHVGVFGGVRRFIELGNELVRRGHEYRILHPEGTAPDWIPFAGGVARLEDGLAERWDLAFCGDPGVFDAFARVRADRRVMFVLGQRYGPKYQAFWTPEVTVVGVNEDWREWVPGIPGHTVAGGIDLARFRPAELRPDDPGRPFRVLGFGRLDKKVKGVKYLFAGMRRLGRGAQLALYDNAPIDLPWTARWFLEVELYVGLDQEALAALYRSADVVASPEVSAGWSNSVAEAMASRVAVVCTPAGTAALASDGETALVVPRGDGRALGDALRRLRADPTLRQRIAGNGWRRVQDYSWSKTCDRLLGAIAAADRSRGDVLATRPV